MTSNQTPQSNIASLKPKSQEQSEDTLTSSSTSFDRKKFQKRNKREVYNTCFEAYEVQSEDFGKPLPFIGDRIRIGIGGESLTVLLINNDEPVTFHNIADSETLDISIIAVMDTDCTNIVTMK